MGETKQIPVGQWVSSFISKPQFECNEDLDAKLAIIVNECAVLDREIVGKTSKLEAHKNELKGLRLMEFLPTGKYITREGNTMSISEATKYSELDSQEVFNYVLENCPGFSFKTLFSVGITKLKEIIGAKADSFRKKDGVTLKISFK